MWKQWLAEESREPRGKEGTIVRQRLEPCREENGYVDLEHRVDEGPELVTFTHAVAYTLYIHNVPYCKP